MCRLLLSHGADPNHANSAVGWTALHYAAYQGHPLVVDIDLDDDIGEIDDDTDNIEENRREAIFVTNEHTFGFCWVAQM